MNIPKIIHFIWAGGDMGMPPRAINIVKLWHIANPTFDIYFWVDSSSVSTPREATQILENYRREFSALGDKIFFKEINDSRDLDGQRVRVSDDYSRYEIDRIRPNYGASSDLLRCKILHEFGGAYFDSDVEPGKCSLEASGIFSDGYDRHQLFVDANSQNQGIVGNDAFITTQPITRGNI